MLDLKQIVAEYFRTTGTPVGHGYTQQNLDRRHRLLLLRQAATSTASRSTPATRTATTTARSTSAQFDWLTQRAEAHSSRYLDANGHWVTGNGADKLIMIFSHHTVETMENSSASDRVDRHDGGEPAAAASPTSCLGQRAHAPQPVGPHPRPAGTAVGGGFWEVNTASHIDWPQQSRVIELVDNGDGTLSIFGDDHRPRRTVRLAGAAPRRPLELAALSRELGANDPQRDAETATEDGKRGTVRTATWSCWSASRSRRSASGLPRPPRTSVAAADLARRARPRPRSASTPTSGSGPNGSTVIVSFAPDALVRHVPAISPSTSSDARDGRAPATAPCAPPCPGRSGRGRGPAGTGRTGRAGARAPGAGALRSGVEAVLGQPRAACPSTDTSTRPSSDQASATSARRASR